MRVFVTGGTGHSGSYIIPELIAAGHEVTGLARSDASAAALSALGAKVRRGDLEDLDGLKEAAASSDGVIHVAHRQDLLPSGGMDAVAAAELPIMLAYGEALAGTGKPLVTAGASARPGTWGGRPPRRTRPSPPARSTRAPCGSATSWKGPLSTWPSRGCGLRSCGSPHRARHDRPSRLPPHADRAREGEGVRRLPRGRHEPVERRAHPRCRRLVPPGAGEGAGRQVLARGRGRGHPFRDIAEAIAGRLGLPAVSVPRRTDDAGVLRVPRQYRHAGLPGLQPHHPPGPRLGTRPARSARRSGQRPLLPAG